VGAWVLSSILAGAALGCAEILLLLCSGFASSLTRFETWRYGLLAFCWLFLCSLFATSIGQWIGKLAVTRANGRGSSPAKTVGLVFSGLGAPVVFVVYWSLTSGRRAQEVPLRLFWVLLAAAVTCLIAGRLARELYPFFNRKHREGARLISLGLFFLSLAALFADAFILPRLYPAFHWALAALCVTSMACAWSMEFTGTTARLPRRPALVGTVCSVLLAFVTLLTFRQAPNAWTVVAAHAPLTGKVVQLAGEIIAPPSEASFDTSSVTSSVPINASQVEPGINLQGKDIFLITVDALRADRVSVYGGGDLTPNLHNLASQSVVFLRAYTPAPHTFYAIGSIMTGEFLRSTQLVSSGGTERSTLAELMKAEGYGTAAFYPGAVSSVDKQGIAELTTRHFGFDDCRIGYATAPQLVDAINQYLSGQPQNRRLFVWAHVFEPHEPYTPPAGYARGNSDLALYEGEVRAADEGIGDLIKGFRRVRPTATVIVTADHGEEFGEHGGHYHGTTLYDEQIRVPLIWSSPGVTQPAQIEFPVETVDITVTLLNALGIAPGPLMQGDDLGPILQGKYDNTPGYAFAEIGELRMITDGRFKAIFPAKTSILELYDLRADAGEKRNLSALYPDKVKAFGEALARQLSQTARLSRLAATAQSDWPEALTRARLGDPSAGSDLLPLLGSTRLEVRKAAARACGELDVKRALPVISRLREKSGEPASHEAAIAALRLGDPMARSPVKGLLKLPSSDVTPDDLDLARRAALALAGIGDASGGNLLIGLAKDEGAPIMQRKRALAALGTLRVKRAIQPLGGLLGNPYLSIEAAKALGDIRDKRAVSLLQRQLANERYLAAREAEIDAIKRITAKR
jgi:arylsulfatase A-like enzyme